MKKTLNQTKEKIHTWSQPPKEYLVCTNCIARVYNYKVRTKWERKKREHGQEWERKKNELQLKKIWI